jgi:guanine deaminase
MVPVVRDALQTTPACLRLLDARHIGFSIKRQAQPCRGTDLSRRSGRVPVVSAEVRRTYTQDPAYRPTAGQCACAVKLILTLPSRHPPDRARLMLTDADKGFLLRAIDLSRSALEVRDTVPFAAVVVLDGEEIGRGTNRVVELLDPSAHAEIMALRDAAKKVRKYLLPGSVLYSSCEPCPMCLAACYWARVSRIVFGASSSQAAEHGFQDLAFYRELAAAPGQRSIPEISASDPLRAEAAAVLKRWPPSKPLSVV